MRGTIEIIEVGDFNPPRFDVRFRSLAWHPGEETGTLERGIGVEVLASAVEVPAPGDWPVPNDANATLASALPWYLETFPHQPTAGGQLRARFVRQALQDWGDDVFENLFPEGEPRDRFAYITGHALRPVGEVEIQSANAEILAWPWEALREASGRRIGETVTVRRHVGANSDSYGIYSLRTIGAPLRVLWLLSRSGPEDVSYREGVRAVASVSGVEVDVLRPATIASLQDRLRAASGMYDVLHVDCHGLWDAARGSCLLQLHDGDGEAQYVTADDLIEALEAGEVPIVALNACRSAMAGYDGETAFQSLAVDLFDASCVLDVVAMSYKFPTASAAPFLRGFYGALRSGETVGEAVSHGRFNMKGGRPDQRLGGDDDTWLVPTAYARTGFIPERIAHLRGSGTRPRLTADYYGHDEQMYLLDHIGPDDRGMVITGMAGCGKSRFLEEWVTWRQATGSTERFVKLDGSTAKDWLGVITQLAEQLGLHAGSETASVSARTTRLIETLEAEEGWLIIDAADSLTAPDADAERLVAAIAAAKNVRIILAFSAPRPWMRVFSGISGLSLSRMDAEARHPLIAHLAQQFLADGAAPAQREALDRCLESPALATLVFYLAGNPGMMRWVARNIAAGRDPTELHHALRDGGTADLLKFDGADELQHVLRRFDVFDDPAVAMVAPLLAMHDELVDWRLIERMAERLSGIEDHVGDAREALRERGLFEQIALHPALAGELRSRFAASISEPQMLAFASVLAEEALDPTLLEPRAQLTFGSMVRAQSILFAAGDCQLAIRLNASMRENYFKKGMVADAMRTARSMLEQHDDLPDHAFEQIIFDIIDTAQLAGDAYFAKQCIAHPRLVAMCQRDHSLAAVQMMFTAKITRLQGDYSAALNLFDMAAGHANEGPERSAKTLLHDETEEITVAAMIRREIAITKALVAAQGNPEYDEAQIAATDTDDWESGYDEGTAAELRERALLAQKDGNLQRALRLADQAVRKDEARGFEHGHAIGLSTRSDILAKLGETDKARDGYERAISIFERIGDQRSIAISHHQWGKAAHLAGLYQEAAENLILSAKIFQQCGDTATVTLIARNFETFLRELNAEAFGALFASNWIAEGLPPTPGLTAMGDRLESILRSNQGGTTHG